MARNTDFKLNLANMPASLWKRTLAYIIDVFIVNFVVAFPFKNMIQLDSVTTFSDTYHYLSSAPELTQKLFFVFLAIGTLTVLYWAVFEYRLKQSIGKMIMNISVKSTKGDLTFRATILRNLSKVSSLTLAFDVFYLLYKKTNQRYLEKLSGTEVIEGASLK